MIEAFEIGVSIALSDDLSSSVARAQQEIEQLQKSSSANKLTLEAINSAALRAMSVSGLSQPDRRGSPGPGARESARPGAMDVATAQAIAVQPISAVTNQDPRTGETSSGFSDDTTVDSQPRAESQNFLEPLGQTNNAGPAFSAANMPKQPTATSLPVEKSVDSIETDKFTSLLSNDTGDKPFAAPRITHNPAQSQPETAFAADHRPLAPASEQVSGSNIVNADDADGAGRGAVDLSADWTTNYLSSTSQSPVSLLTLTPDLLPAPPDVSASVADQPATLLSGGPADLRSTLTDPDHDAVSVNPAPGGKPTRLAKAALNDGKESEAGLGQCNDREQGQIQGDVFLDGALVGRWISRFLRRESERANNGPNGFNLRRSQVLPGVTVG